LEILAAGRRAVELETEETSPWFAFAHFALGHGHYVAGDLQAAMSELPKAAYTQHSLAIIRQFALAVMAMVAREQDDLALSARYAQEAVAVVEQASLGAVPQASTAYTVMAESTADQGDLATAMAAMTEILAVRHRFPGLSPWPTIHHLLAMSRVSTSAGELDLAGQLLDEAAQLMARFPEEGMAGMRARLTAARVRLRRRAEADHGLEPLTGRELDVLRLLQTSMNLTEIADALYLSRNTVKTHVQASYRKLGASSRSEAVSIARRRALL
jgi:LuxR family maltose regulon positive regulatory protein